MSLIIVSEITRIDGNTVGTELYHNKENNTVRFLQPFETYGYSPLVFGTEKEILDFLDGIFPDEPEMVIVLGDKHYSSIYYPSSQGDRLLTFFGYIKEV